jgi:dTDP-4-amino-4,6-dideoxygalactose transaminase
MRPGALQLQVRRHLALLGGTTSYADCLGVLWWLCHPGMLVDGIEVDRYERAFASHVGVRHGISLASGRVGLYAILRSLGIGGGDEVLIQVPTHIVVANAIRYTGARPVYVDCRAGSSEIDLDHAERVVTARTRAIVVQHTYGIPVDLDRALEFAGRHDLELIEDCVHSLGATYRGRRTGSFGRAAFFSTEETKIISTTLGGMVVTDDDGLAARLHDFVRDECHPPSRRLVAKYLVKLVAYHMLTEPMIHASARRIYDAVGIQPLPKPVSDQEFAGKRPRGYLRRFSNAQAAMGRRQLLRIESNLAHRRSVAEVYRSTLARAGVDPFPFPSETTAPSWCRYPIRVDHRAHVEAALRRYTQVGLWFSSVLEESVSPEVGQYQPGSCPNAEALTGHVVNLPTHGRVTVEDAVRLAEVVVRSVSSGRGDA